MRLTPECCSVHTHSVLCDGKGTLAEMAAAAYAAGVRFFGASGHSHTEIPHDAGNVLPTDPAEYREQVLRLREEYAGRMEVLLGIEQDSRSAQPVPDWADYWIPWHRLGPGAADRLPGPDVRRRYAGPDRGLLPGCSRHGGPKTRHSGPH